MIPTTRTPIDQDWAVETTCLDGETYYRVTYDKHLVAEVVDEAGTWSLIRRPSLDDPAIPAVVFAAIPHNDGLLRGLLYN